jgi:hypothetical protein
MVIRRASVEGQVARNRIAISETCLSLESLFIDNRLPGAWCCREPASVRLAPLADYGVPTPESVT